MSDGTARIRLLMIDDEQEFLDSSAPALERRGFDVHQAADGETALKMIVTDKFDAVVLDLKMPGLDGEEVFRRIHRARPDLPVIMLTGHGTIKSAFETSREGIADYIAKPCDIDVLAERLRRLIDRAGEPPADRSPEAGTETIKTLLVDNDMELLESLRPGLERRHMTVEIAGGGEESLESLTRFRADIAVVNIGMPGLDGMRLLKLIKETYPAVHVILTTGHPSAETAMEGIQAGAAEYLTKPLEMDTLVETIRRVYGSRHEDLSGRQKRLLNEIRGRYPE